MLRRRGGWRRSLPVATQRDATAERGDVHLLGEIRPAASHGDLLLASAVAAVAALLLRVLLGVPTPAELIGDRVTILIPLPLFSALLDVFGTLAKHLFFVGLLIGEWLVSALAGMLYLRLRTASRTIGVRLAPELSAADLIALPVWLWLVSAGIVATLIGGGPFGAALPGGVSAGVLSQTAPDLAFAATLLWLSRRPTRVSADSSGSVLSRRRLLRQTASALALVAGGALAWEALSSGLASLFGLSRSQVAQVSAGAQPTLIVPAPVPAYGPWTPVLGLTPEVTSAGNFYYVSKNLVGDPHIASSSWQLTIGGMARAPYALSYDELLALPRVERYHTLECISNPVGGNLISNGRFTGTRLVDVLNKAGIQPGASELIFHAADGYSDSLHLSQALDPDALLVYLLDGQPLPQAHGFPARLLIPGLYGMKNGKWLTGLELGSGGYSGYWEQQGWTREARVKIMSRIDVPSEGDLLSVQPTYVAGVAYSGARGVARVDVSTDGGHTWQPATLRRPLGSLTWVLWEYRWKPELGHHEIVARAIDLQGEVQFARFAEPLPDGASGYHAISITVG